MVEARRPSVLLVVEHAPPARGGGSITDVAGLVGDRCAVADWHVVTGCRDVDGSPLAAVAGEWTALGSARVIRVPKRRRSPRQIARLAREVGAELVVTNSIFAWGSMSAQVARRCGLLRGRPLVLAPHGELSPGALLTSRPKKQLFFAVSRPLGLQRGVAWRATTEDEAQLIRARFPRAGTVHVVGVALPPVAPGLRVAPVRTAATDPLRLVSVGRIAAKKGLLTVLEALAGWPATAPPVELDLVGPVTEPAYRQQCDAVVARLPAAVTVRFHDVVAPSEVPRWFGVAHVAVMPTLGENFGYTVLEALDCACPVMVSDRTPWSHLQADGAGWVLPADDAGAWREALLAVAVLPAAELRRYSQRAAEVAAAAREADASHAAWQRLFAEHAR